jgi:hypothetical protein
MPFEVYGPDGKSVTFPDGTDEATVVRVMGSIYSAPAAQPTPPAQPAPEPQKELGFSGALREGLTVLGDVPEALGFAFDKEGAREELVKARETEEKRATGFGGDKSLAENWQTLKEVAGESLGQLAAPVAAGFAGTMVGGPLVGLGAAATTAFSQYGVQNLARQAEEDEARIARGEEPLGPMPGRAAAAAAGQAGLDLAGARFFRPLAELFPFARPLLGAGGKKAAGETAEAVVDAARKGQLSFAGGIARGTAKGAAFEMPQEIAQTALERWQAGLPLDSDDALEEYKQSAIGALVLGGGVGAVSGGVGVAKERLTAGEEPPAPTPPPAAEEEAVAPAPLVAEFDRLYTAEVASVMQANPGMTREEAVKGVRERAGDIAEQARVNVRQAQEAQETQEAGAGLDGGDRGPDVDVAGAAGPSVPDIGITPPAEEVAEGPPTAEPVGVAGTGVPVGGTVAPEAADVGALTPERREQLANEMMARVMMGETPTAPAPAPIDVTAELTPESLIAEVEQAAADGLITPGLANAARNRIETGESSLADIKTQLDTLVNNALASRMGVDETVAPTPPTETVAEAEAAPAETVEDIEAEEDLLAPARGEMAMKDRKDAVRPIVGLLVDGSIKDVKIPTGFGKKDLSAIKTQATNQISQRVARNEAVDPAAVVDAILREKGFEIAERAPAAAPTPTAAPTSTAAPTPTAAPAPTAAPTSTAAPAPAAGAPPAAPPPPPPTGGPAPQPGGKGPKKPAPVKLTEAQLQSARRAAGLQQTKANKMQKRVAATREASEVLSTSISLAKLLRGDKENLAILRAALDTLSTGGWKALLPTLSTGDIFRILKGRVEGLQNADRIIRDGVARYEAKEYQALAKELETISKFLKKFPKAAQVLSDLQFMSVAYQVDPTKAPTAQDYINNVDKRLKELRAQRAQATDNKERASLSKQITTREKAIRAVYEGGDVDSQRVSGWQDISKPEFGGGKGAEIFTLIRDAHRRDLLNNYKAIQDRIVATSAADVVDERLEKLKETFTPALEQVIYFPLMRYGDHFLRVGTGAESIYMMFPSLLERNKARNVMQARGQDVTEYGNVKELRAQFEQSDDALRGVLGMFDENSGKDMDTLREQVFDLWLQTATVGDMTKHLAPREMRAGYSTDILKNFANFRRSSLSNTKRATFGHQLKVALSQARDSIQGSDEQDKLNEFVNEIELRALGKLLPETPDNSIFKQAIELGNKMAFYQYLANAKTGLIQLTQLHIASFPVLAQKYGTAKAGAALAKYGFSSLGGFVVSPLKAIKRANGEFEFDWQQPNLRDNPITSLKESTDPQLYEVLSEGWEAGRDINMYLDTFAQSIAQMGTTDPEQQTALQKLMQGRADIAAIRGAKFVFNAMGGLMHQMERVNREATYMAALELGYREARKRGLSHEKAKAKAIEDATGNTLEATFDFSAYNKPRVFNEGVGRVAGQFFTYPYMMSSLLARNLFTAIKKGPLEPGERAAAAQIAAGTLMNIGLYAGLTGLPFYGLGKVIGYMTANLFDDDDEEGGLTYFDPETGDLRATYDIDWWFRNVWIPKFFGPGGTAATLFGLSPDQAKMLELSAAKGPISALTDIDLANSVALDFFFFLPEEPRADTLEGQLVETVFNTVLGASGSMLLDYAKAGRDLMNGYTERALEKLPKVMSNPLKAARFAEEGQLNYQDELVGMGKDFWTSDKLILQSLGFASTGADRATEQAYGAKGIEKKIEEARNRALDQFKMAVRRMEKEEASPEAEAALEETLAAVDEYNQMYPTHPISGPSLAEAAQNTAEKMRKSRILKGMPFDMEGKTPYLNRIMQQRMGDE